MTESNLSQRERVILRTTYLKIAMAEAALTDLFYQRLFEIDPALRSLFTTPMRVQGTKWRLTLNLIIAAIDQPAKIQAYLRELGQRHVGYGVKNEDYQKLIDAVLWAIQQYLGEEFTPEVDTAWRKLFAFVVACATTDQENTAL